MLLDHVFVQVSPDRERRVRTDLTLERSGSCSGNVRLAEVSPGIGHEGEGLCAEEAGHNVALGSNEGVLDGICNTNHRALINRPISLQHKPQSSN